MTGPQFAFFIWVLFFVVIGNRAVKSYSEMAIASTGFFGPLIAILWWGGFFA